MYIWYCRPHISRSFWHWPKWCAFFFFLSIQTHKQISLRKQIDLLEVWIKGLVMHAWYCRPHLIYSFDLDLDVYVRIFLCSMIPISTLPFSSPPTATWANKQIININLGFGNTVTWTVLSVCTMDALNSSWTLEITILFRIKKQHPTCFTDLHMCRHFNFSFFVVLFLLLVC